MEAQEPSDFPEFEARVKLSVYVDGGFRAIVRSYMSQRLWALDGVVVTSDDPDYGLSAPVIETETKAGTRMDYAISSVGVNLWRQSMLERTRTVYGFTEAQMAAIRCFAGTGLIVYHLLQIGAESDLEDICKEPVATFDSGALESSREMMQRDKDTLK